MAINPAGLRFKQSGSTSSATVTKPNLTIQGDLMVVFATGTTAPTAPAGWVQIGVTSPKYGNYYGNFWRKIHGDEAGTTSYTFTNADYLWICTFPGADTSSPIGAIGSWESETSTTAPTYSGLTTTVPNSLAIAECYDYVSLVTFTSPSGWTEYVDANGGTINGKAMPTPGATGSMDWTSSASSDFFMLAFEILPSTISRRLYFDSAASAPITPSSWCAQWDLNTGSALTRRLNDVRGSSAQSWRTFLDNVSTNNQDSALARFVTKLGTGVLSGSFLAVLQSYETNTACNAFSQISIKVIDPSGADRGVAYAGQTNTATSGSEFPGTAQANAANRYFPKATLSRALTSVTHYEGDGLVVEVGYRKNTTSTLYTAGFYIGEPSATDLTDLNETETTDNTPWIEFPYGIALEGEGPDMRDGQTATYLRRIE